MTSGASTNTCYTKYSPPAQHAGLLGRQYNLDCYSWHIRNGKRFRKSRCTRSELQRFHLFPGSEPVCSQFINGSTVLLQCYVLFRGNWAPVMEWSQDSATHPVADLDVVNQTIRNVSVTSTLTVSMEQIKHSQYTCTTKFIASMNPMSINASNVPYYTFTWTSEKMNYSGKIWLMGERIFQIFSTLTYSSTIIIRIK